jgi:hypothetical protein
MRAAEFAKLKRGARVRRSKRKVARVAGVPVDQLVICPSCGEPMRLLELSTFTVQTLHTGTHRRAGADLKRSAWHMSVATNWRPGLSGLIAHEREKPIAQEANPAKCKHHAHKQNRRVNPPPD